MNDRKLKQGLSLLFGFIGLMWLVFVVELVAGTSSALPWGIIPRHSEGLKGIITAPFFHEGLQHIVANTIPLTVLGLLVLISAPGELAFVLQVSILVSGIGTWIFGSPGSHIGASGVIFGLFGFLLFRSVYDRRITSFLITILVAVVYGGAMLLSLVPTERVSWSAHFFGFLGGLLAARHRYGRKRLQLVR